jgi:hypothetical protein
VNYDRGSERDLRRAEVGQNHIDDCREASRANKLCHGDCVISTCTNKLAQSYSILGEPEFY